MSDAAVGDKEAASAYWDGWVRVADLRALAVCEDWLASHRFLSSISGSPAGSRRRRPSGATSKSGSARGDVWTADGNYDETLDPSPRRAPEHSRALRRPGVCAGRVFLRGLRKRSGRCRRVRRSCPGDDCATSGVWRSSSGGTAAHSPSVNARRTRSNGSMWFFMPSGRTVAKELSTGSGR